MTLTLTCFFPSTMRAALPIRQVPIDGSVCRHLG